MQPQFGWEFHASQARLAASVSHGRVGGRTGNTAQRSREAKCVGILRGCFEQDVNNGLGVGSSPLPCITELFVYVVV